MATTTRNTLDCAPAGLAATTLLRLMQLTSPALPVGGFSYSEGLEAAVEARLVVDEPQATLWLLDQLHLGLARSELAVAARAFDAWQSNDAAALAHLNAWVQRTRESAELRQQSEQMGRSLLAWLRNCDADERSDSRLALLAALEPAPNWVVAFALAAAQTGAARRDAMLSLAFAWAENMVQAAMKCVPLGQASAQRMLAALIDRIPGAVDHAATLPEAEHQAFTPMLAILSAQHETQYSRLFRS
ncbi:MAG: urease accessory UreF family protein [Burkholderiaceae bacterium]